MKQEFDSVEATGAKPGDTVICTGVTDESLRDVRYTVGRKYTVVEFCGNLRVKGNGHGSGAGLSAWTIPMAGYGATWKLA